MDLNSANDILLAPPATTQSDSVQMIRTRSSSNVGHDESREVFNKIINTNRNTPRGKKGVLFITWKDDDMQCKEKEVYPLCHTFKAKFGYDTRCFEIPTERSQTSLLKEISAFFHEYDRQDNLAILYYAGHAYKGEDDKFMLSAKFEPDKYGQHPEILYENLLSNLRSPCCDQLLIFDCCYASRAANPSFKEGTRKFELLASAGKDERCAIPDMPESFGRRLNEWLVKLLDENPNGFTVQKLYEELSNTVPRFKSPDQRFDPRLYNLSQCNLGSIYLRPQHLQYPTSETKPGFVCMTVTFELREFLVPVIINDIASRLSFLPHVENIFLNDILYPEEIKSIGNQTPAAIVKQIMPFKRILKVVRNRKAGQANENTFTEGFVIPSVLRQQPSTMEEGQNWPFLVRPQKQPLTSLSSSRLLVASLSALLISLLVASVTSSKT